MKPNPPQSEADEHISLEHEASSDHEYSEADSLLHDQDDPSSGEGPSIAETSAATAGRFYARLRTELGKRGIGYAEMPRLTQEGETPPCFKAAGVPFEMWLASASLLRATVPYRFDMPAEPNYCYDCRSDFKKAAMKAGNCRFPHVKFERVQTIIRDEAKTVFETETVGVSRNPELIYGDDDE